MDDQTARARLEQMLQDLAQSEQTLRDENDGESVELSHVDQHPADVATDVTENDRDEAMVEVVQAQRLQVQEALARLDAGTYGRCVVDGEPIPDERLDARPEAARCITHQAEQESAG